MKLTLYGLEKRDYDKYFKDVSTYISSSPPKNIGGDFYVRGILQAVDIDFPPLLVIECENIGIIKNICKDIDHLALFVDDTGKEIMRGPSYDYWDW